MLAVVAASKLAASLLVLSQVVMNMPGRRGLPGNANAAVDQLRDRLQSELQKPIDLWGVKIGSGGRVSAAERAVLQSFLKGA